MIFDDNKAIYLLLYSAPLTIVLTRRFSFRVVSFVGGIMVGCGYFLSGFVEQMELMYLTFTIVGMYAWSQPLHNQEKNKHFFLEKYCACLKKEIHISLLLNITK